MTINVDTLEIKDNPAMSRFETQIDGELAVAQYRRKDNSIIFTHTEVPEAFRGQGVAGKLVGYALDQARAQELNVVPRCPYVAEYIHEHPEYQPLVRGA